MLLPTLPYSYINNNKLYFVVKFVYIFIIYFHYDRDERRHCTFHCNLNGPIENVYTSRSYMLISIIKYLFYYLYRQLQVIDSFKYVEMEIHH